MESRRRTLLTSLACLSILAVQEGEAKERERHVHKVTLIELARKLFSASYQIRYSEMPFFMEIHVPVSKPS